MWVETAKGLESLAKGRSSSLWGCELKHRNMVFLIGSGGSSSLWGCELKRETCTIDDYSFWSSSLWGCELKRRWNRTSWWCGGVILLVRMWVETAVAPFLAHTMYCHPPCEDVSWNLNWSDRRSRVQCHPPCEDVSWNCVNLRFMSITSVILLVRMWVETERDLHSDEIPLSSSVCGCELKRYAHWWYRLRSGVILLVRMWVETWLRRATWRS